MPSAGGYDSVLFQQTAAHPESFPPSADTSGDGNVSNKRRLPLSIWTHSMDINKRRATETSTGALLPPTAHLNETQDESWDGLSYLQQMLQGEVMGLAESAGSGVLEGAYRNSTSQHQPKGAWLDEESQRGEDLAAQMASTLYHPPRRIPPDSSYHSMATPTSSSTSARAGHPSTPGSLYPCPSGSPVAFCKPLSAPLPNVATAHSVTSDARRGRLSEPNSAPVTVPMNYYKSRRQTHIHMERKYRQDLNTCIKRLHSLVTEGRIQLFVPNPHSSMDSNASASSTTASASAGTPSALRNNVNTSSLNSSSSNQSSSNSGTARAQHNHSSPNQKPNKIQILKSAVEHIRELMKLENDEFGDGHGKLEEAIMEQKALMEEQKKLITLLKDRLGKSSEALPCGPGQEVAQRAED